jgi:hypothetical protein
MSGSATPGPSTAGHRHAIHLQFWLLMVICSARVQSPSLGMPGDPGRQRRAVRCPECAKLGTSAMALRQPDGSYECRKRHKFHLKKGSGR